MRSLLVLWLLLTMALAAEPPSRCMQAPPMQLPVCSNPDAPGDMEKPPPPIPGGPIVTVFEPPCGHPGERVTIHGKNLMWARVIFNQVQARIEHQQDDLLVVVIPESTTWPIRVETPQGTTVSDTPFVYALGGPGPDGRVAAVPYGGGAWYPRHLYPVRLDANSEFLQRHWEQPLKPQGEPAKRTSPLERDLAPEACGTCHVDQYKGWKGALHSHTADDLVLWNARHSDVDYANRCLWCHSPLAEQRGFTKDDLEPNDDAGTPLPHYVDRTLFRRGVVCAACHVRDQQRYGPPARPGQWQDVDPKRPPHAGFTASQAFEDSRFCAGCHTFTIRVNNKMVGNPFEEWRQSRFATEGVSCQGCHMPERRHMWRGIHDRAMVLSGLRLELAVRRGADGSATATGIVTSTHVGHMFPTYGIPMVHVKLYHQAGGGWTEMGHSVIGRLDDLAKMTEIFDHRLAPGQSMSLSRTFQPGAGDRARLVIDVVPRDDYETGLRGQLQEARRHGDIDEQERIEARLESQTALRYRLIDMVVPIPQDPGTTARRVVLEGQTR